MKKTILFIISLLLLGSCSGNDDQSVIEESVEITDGYVDTLENSIQDAKAVKEQYDTRNDTLQNAIQNAKE